MHTSTRVGRKVRYEKNREEGGEAIQLTGRGQATVVPAHLISATIDEQQH
jgi:hypothetical protein